MARKISIKKKIHDIIFTTNSRYAYLFDVWLLIFITLSCFVVILESVDTIYATYGTQLNFLEWFFTIIFTMEYLLRIYSSKRPVKYILSGWGIIDLLAIVPTYSSLFLTVEGLESIDVIRVLRMIRVFRVFDLKRYFTAGNIMMIALRKSRPKILYFLLFILLASIVLGGFMYVVEGEANDQINSIPDAIYWAIVTLTTVGYGDVVPVTILGKIIASFIMILGYGIIAVPTGIVSAEITHANTKKKK